MGDDALLLLGVCPLVYYRGQLGLLGTPLASAVVGHRIASNMPRHTLVIRGGLIVDGSGVDLPFVADVAVDGADIVIVGTVKGEGATEIDARGKVVTPGFIDLHTHLDPYAFWQPSMAPAVYHGITTCLMGNCSVSLAPCRAQATHRDVLAELMQLVEEVPKASLLEKLPWNWESFGEYLDAVETCHPAINVAGLASLGAVRMGVVGPERLWDPTESFTDQEVAEIAALARETVAGGAFGISSIRNRAHRDPSGRPPPGNYSSDKEIEAICKAIGPELGGLWQTIPNMGADHEDPGTPTEVYMRELALFRKACAAGAKVLFAPGNFGAPGREGSQDMGVAEATDKVCREIAASGGTIHAVQMPRTFGMVTGLETRRFPRGSKLQTPRWRDLASEPLFASRVAMVSEDGAAKVLLEEASATEEMEGQWSSWARQNYYLGDAGEEPRYPHVKGQQDGRCDVLAQQRGLHPAALWLALTEASRGTAKFYAPFANKLTDVMELHLASEWCLPG